MSENKKVNLSLLNGEDAAALDATYSKINELISDDNVSGLSVEEKDSLYETVVTEYNKLISQIKEMRISFSLKPVEIKYMLNLINEKLSYKPADLFVALSLKDSVLSKYPNVDTIKEDFDVPLTADNINILNYVLNLHTVVGLKSGAYTFSKIYERLGEAAKVFNHWDNLSKKLQDNIDNWSILLTPEVVAPELVTAAKLEPVAESVSEQQKTTE